MTSALTGEHFYVTSHTLYYNTKEPIPIAEVVSALQGLEYVLRSVPGVLARITDTRIAEAEFFVERIESGSLAETVLIKLFFQDEEEFKKFLDKIREKPMLRNTIVGVAIGGLLTYGAMWAASNTGRTAANITANNNVIINVGAGQVGLTEQGLKSIIESSVRSNSELAKNAVRVIAPAKREAGTSLTISGEDSSTIVIGPEAVAETPEKINPPADSSIEHLKGVDVALRAYDLDNKKNGWAGKIEGRTPRVKIELHPLVDETALFGKASINADVIIVHKLKSGAKSMTPEKIIIEKLN